MFFKALERKSEPVELDSIQAALDEICMFGPPRLSCKDRGWHANAEAMHRGATIRVESGFDCKTPLAALTEVIEKIRGLRS